MLCIVFFCCCCLFVCLKTDLYWYKCFVGKKRRKKTVTALTFIFKCFIFRGWRLDPAHGIIWSLCLRSQQREAREVHWDAASVRYLRKRRASLRRAVGSLQFGLKPESVWAAETHLSFSATGGENNTTPPVLPCPQICISPLISKVRSLARTVQEANG